MLCCQYPHPHFPQHALLTHSRRHCCCLRPAAASQATQLPAAYMQTRLAPLAPGDETGQQLALLEQAQRRMKNLQLVRLQMQQRLLLPAQSQAQAQAQTEPAAPPLQPAAAPQQRGGPLYPHACGVAARARALSPLQCRCAPAAAAETLVAAPAQQLVRRQPFPLPPAQLQQLVLHHSRGHRLFGGHSGPQQREQAELQAAASIAGATLAQKHLSLHQHPHQRHRRPRPRFLHHLRPTACDPVMRQDHLRQLQSLQLRGQRLHCLLRLQLRLFLLAASSIRLCRRF